MAKAKPEVTKDSGEDDLRVWGEVKITVRLGEYESITVALGESRPCANKDRTKTRKRIIDECEELAAKKARKVRTYWLRQST
jgi:hypothetical protein